MSDLRRIREQRGLTQKQLAERIHTTDVSVSRYETEDQRLTLPLLRQLAAELHCSIAELAGETPFGHPQGLTRGEVLELSGEDYAAIPVYDIRASAGFGSMVDEGPSVHSHLYRAQWLRSVTNAKPSELAVIEVWGDSMEPTLHNGDHVLVDRTVKNVGRDGIYVFRLAASDELLIKRCTRLARTGLLTIKSDNPAYAPEEGVRDKDIEMVGRVIWLGRSVGG